MIKVNDLLFANKDTGLVLPVQSALHLCNVNSNVLKLLNFMISTENLTFLYCSAFLLDYLTASKNCFFDTSFQVSDPAEIVTDLDDRKQ